MKIARYILLCILIGLLVLLFSKEAEIERVSSGVVDYSLAYDEVIGLYGDWEFYFDKAKDEIDNIDKEYKSAPGFWNSYEEGYDKYGYATYKLKVCGIEKNECYTFFVPTIGTSANIYILMIN